MTVDRALEVHRRRPDGSWTYYDTISPDPGTDLTDELYAYITATELDDGTWMILAGDGTESGVVTLGSATR